MRVDLHAKVLTRDGDSAGHVQHALIDPNTNEITHFVVSTGTLLGRDILVPLDEVDQVSSDGDTLRLRLNNDQLEQLTTYQAADYGPPPPGWTAPPTTVFPYSGLVWPVTSVPSQLPTTAREPWQSARDVLIEKGSLVVDHDGADVGVVEDIVVGPDGAQLEAVDVRLGGPLRTLLPGGEIIRLGVDLVETVEPVGIRLRIGKDALPPRRT